MFKKFYQKDVSKIKPNAKLKKQLAAQLFQSSVRKERSALGLNLMKSWPLQIKKMTVITVLTLLISLSAFSFNHISNFHHNQQQINFSTNNFFEKVYAAYDAYDVKESPNAILYTKTVHYNGKGEDSYLQVRSQKMLAYTALHQPEKLHHAQELVKEFLDIGLDEPLKPFTQERWKDGRGNSLKIDQIKRNGEMKIYFGHLKKVDSNTGKITYYDNDRFANYPKFDPETNLYTPLLVKCVETPENIPNPYNQLIEIYFYENKDMEVSSFFPMSSTVTEEPAEPKTQKNDLILMKNFADFYVLLEQLKTEKNPQNIIKILQSVQNSSFPHISFQDIGEREENGKIFQVFKLSQSFEDIVAFETDYDLQYDFSFPITNNNYYYFDTTTYQLVKEIRTTIVDEKEYEMESIEYFQQYLTQNENSPENIFDPSKYPKLTKYEGDPGCYFNHNTQEMTKMSEEEYKKFWSELTPEQLKSIEKQKKEVLEQIGK